MATALIIFLSLVVLHFVYEGIILPSIRLKLRFSLFELRDNLRTLVCEKQDELDAKAFKYLQESINNSIAFLYRIDIRALIEIPRILKRNTTLYQRIEERSATIDACPLEEFQMIKKRGYILIALAFLANSAGFFLILLPIALFVVLCGKIRNWSNDIRKRIISIVCVPENEIDEVNRIVGFSGL